MFSPTVFQIEWKTSVEPVKWIPARCSLASTGSPTSAPLPEEVHHSGRQARFLEQLQRPVRRERSCRGGLPEHDVAHQRGAADQVRADRREVERADRKDEAL